MLLDSVIIKTLNHILKDSYVVKLKNKVVQNLFFKAKNALSASRVIRVLIREFLYQAPDLSVVGCCTAGAGATSKRVLSVARIVDVLHNSSKTKHCTWN